MLEEHLLVADQMSLNNTLSVLSKVEQAYQLLEEMIVTMQLAPGELLSEANLALQLNLGRTPVREALQRLASEYLVEIMPRRGIRVSEIDIKQQLRLLETRRVIEQLNISLAAKRASPEIKLRFGEIASEMAVSGKTDDYAKFLHLDQEFNELLAVAVDNKFSANMLQQMHGLSRRFWHSHHQQEDDLLLVANLHAAIADAIAVGDEESAVAACRNHMDYIDSFTRKSLDT